MFAMTDILRIFHATLKYILNHISSITAEQIESAPLLLYITHSPPSHTVMEVESQLGLAYRKKELTKAMSLQVL